MQEEDKCASPETEADVKPQRNFAKSIENISFLQKLWVIINSNSAEAIKWNPTNSKTILINLTKLEPVLLTKYGFLKEKTTLDFLRTLFAQGFRKCIKQVNGKENNNVTPKPKKKIFSRLMCKPKSSSILNHDLSTMKKKQINSSASKLQSNDLEIDSENNSNIFHSNSIESSSELKDVCIEPSIEPGFEEFENENFQKGCYNLIENAAKFKLADDIILPLNKEIILNSEPPSVEKISADELVCKKISKLSKLEESRLILQTNLQFQKSQLLLNLRLKESNSLNKKEAVIRLPADSFENCWESISGFVETCEYAGFYGSIVQTDKIKDFFGEYLPVYVQNSHAGDEAAGQAGDGTREVQGFRSEENIDSANEDSLSSFQNNEDVAIDMTKAKPLEPIYNEDKQCKLKEEICEQMDDDISMDELLKFNTKPEKELEEENNDKTDDYSTDENFTTKSLEEEFDENKENTFIENLNAATKENEFNSFLTQYRDTLNVLYENAMD